MKKLITILIAGLITLASYGQSGTIHATGIQLGTAPAAYNLVSTNSYVIEKVGSTCYARPGIGTGLTAYSGTLISSVLVSVMGQLPNGGTIFVKYADYTNVDTITVLYSNITFIGEEGRKPHFTLKANFDVGRSQHSGMFLLKGAKHTVFKNLEIDGNFANQTKKDDNITGNGWAAIISGVIDNFTPWHCDSTVIDNCYIHDFTRFGVFFSLSDNVIVKNSYFKDNAWNGVTIGWYTKYCIVENNRVEGGGDVGITLYGTNDIARHNIVRNISGSYGSTGSKEGIGIEIASNFKPKGNEITDNTIIGGGMNYGIASWSSSRNCIISGNIIDSIGAGPAVGITLMLDSGSMISNNKITNYGHGTTGHGIFLDGSIAVKVFSNYISTNKASSGIQLIVNSGINAINNIISGNYINNSAGYGVNITAGSAGNIFENNIIYGNWGDLIDLNVTAPYNIFNNNWGAKAAKWLANTGLLNNAITATADGLTTGILVAGSQNLTVTSASANNIIALPAASASTIGTKITGIVTANGCELRVQAAQLTTVYINGITTNVEAAIPASVSFQITQIDATHWVLITWTALGAVGTAIIPDAL